MGLLVHLRLHLVEEGLAGEMPVRLDRFPGSRLLLHPRLVQILETREEVLIGEEELQLVPRVVDSEAEVMDLQTDEVCIHLAIMAMVIDEVELEVEGEEVHQEEHDDLAVAVEALVGEVDPEISPWPLLVQSHALDQDHLRVETSNSCEYILTLQTKINHNQGI